jgi:hypothetical protein
MKPTRFILYLAAIVVGMIVSSGGLFLLFERFVTPDRGHDWRSYHEIILDYVPGPRIVIDSGSNSLHAIAPELIERELKRPTFIIADNAAIPLGAKISRLEKYAKSGDLIILPLEWSAYAARSTPADFLEGIMGQWSEYYFVMPEVERFGFFIDHITLNQIISGIWRRLDANPKSERRKSRQRIEEEKSNWSGLTETSLENRKRHISMEGKSCQQYIIAPTGEIRDFVKQTAMRLSKLQKDRRVTVIMTWPAVAGTDCYDFAALDGFVTKFRRIFEEAGIAVIGDPRSSLFSDQHMLDNYYHVDIEAGFARTRRLIEDIKQAGLLPREANTDSPPLETGSAALIAAALTREETRIARNDSMLLSPLAKGAYAPGTEEFDNLFQLSPNGWQDFESWGVWSRGDSSEIVLRPRPNKSCDVRLDAHYFSQSRPSSIFLDGEFLKIDDGSPISVAPGDRPVAIGLRHRDVRSPHELGVSDDPRELAFGLSRIIVGCE